MAIPTVEHFADAVIPNRGVFVTTKHADLPFVVAERFACVQYVSSHDVSSIIEKVHSDQLLERTNIPQGVSAV